MRKASMKTQFLGLALLWAAVYGQDGSPSNGTSTSAQTSTSNVCHVCGEGAEIDNASKLIMTSLGLFTCGGLAGAGEHGNIKASECSSAQALALEKCGCIVGDGSTANQADDESSSGSFCHICPDGGVVTIPDGIVTIPNAPNKTCSDWVGYALAGKLQANQCETVQSYTNETCGCMPEDAVASLNRVEVSNETYVCPVCGEGMRSSKPSASVSIPGQSVRTCAQFERAASLGKITPQQCSMVQAFVMDSCSCEVGDPVAAPTPAPNATAYDCPICGEGKVVTRPSGVVVIPTQPNRTCTELLYANTIGKINENQCSLLQPFVKTPCGCTTKEDTDKPTEIPSDAPSLAPTVPREPTISPAPTGWETQKTGCFDNLKEIYENEMSISDPTVRRLYILCPETTYNLGHLTDDGRINQGDTFLILRPNVRYQCGQDGSRLNNCILKGGDFGLLSFYGVYEGIYETVENVRIEGLTFQSQKLFAAVMEAAGDIEFTDCAFKDQGNMAPILMQWRGDGPKVSIESTEERKLQSSTGSLATQFKERLPNPREETKDVPRKVQEVTPEYRHVVTFRNCVFRGNYVTENMAFPGVIENSFSSELNIINCLFQDNSYGTEKNPAPFGYAIRSYGPVYVESSCFMDNKFNAHGPIQVFMAPHTTINNYVKSSQEDLTCRFLAVFSTQDDTSKVKPVCFDADATSCPFSQPPTMAPTEPEPTNPPVAPAKENTKTTTSGVASIRRGYFTSFIGAGTIILWAVFLC